MTKTNFYDNEYLGNLCFIKQKKQSKDLTVIKNMAIP